MRLATPASTNEIVSVANPFNRHSLKTIDFMADSDIAMQRPSTGTYLTVTDVAVAPSLTLPVTWLSWYERIFPPLAALKPVTLDFTVDSESSTKAPVPCARIPLPPLSSDEVRSSVIEVTEAPAAVNDEMPSNLLSDATLSRICAATKPVEPVPLARMPYVLFWTRVRAIATRAEPVPVGWMTMPPPSDARPLVLMTLSLT